MAKADAESRPIAENRQARFDYFIEERMEAGIVLQGWEVKAMRAGRAQLNEAYAFVKDGEAFLFGAHIAALNSASTHVVPDPIRTRKLLLNRSELQRLIGAVERKGYTLIPLELYWKNGRAKLQLGLAKGKKQHDKRATEKDRDWERDKARLLRRGGALVLDLVDEIQRRQRVGPFELRRRLGVVAHLQSDADAPAVGSSSPVTRARSA